MRYEFFNIELTVIGIVKMKASCKKKSIYFREFLLCDQKYNLALGALHLLRNIFGLIFYENLNIFVLRKK